MLTKIQAAGAAMVAATMVSAARAQQAVQWRTQDGGNGHWYCTVRNASIVSWSDANIASLGRGGYLATVATSAENRWVYDLAQSQNGWTGYFGPWLGGYATPGSQECDPSSWRWVTGEAWNIDVAVWCPGQPDCIPEGSENRLHYWICEAGWNNLAAHGDYGWGGICSYVIEWSADCNNDGLVDYGQIREGHLEDANSNNVPDRCECVAFPALPSCCLGDLNSDRAVDGADLGEFLFAWGPAVPQHPADLDGDGQVDGEDLGLLLANWGPCS